MIEAIDVNHDGLVQYDEFCRLCLALDSRKDLLDQWQRYSADLLDVGDGVTLGKEKKPKKDFSAIFIAGGVSGAISRTLTAPMDRVKVLLQAGEVSGKKISGIRQAVGFVWREGGLKAFWRGNGVNVLKLTPENAVKFFAFNFAKSHMSDKPGVGERFLSGAFAGIVSSISIYPFEVIKTRIATSPGVYSGIAAAFQTIVKKGENF
jgi:solute carrier family 25 phosphate transporter 23/24/25/41